MRSERLTPVIMCGGAGTRLWPVSRETMPKQFVPLIGDRSTFQQTLQRVGDPDLFAGRSSSPTAISASSSPSSCASSASRPTSCSSPRGAIPVRPSRSRPRSRRSATADATVLVLAADHIVRKPETNSSPPAARPLPRPPRGGS